MQHIRIETNHEENHIHICTTADALIDACVPLKEIHRVLAKFWHLTCNQIDEILEIVHEARQDRRALGVEE